MFQLVTHFDKVFVKFQDKVEPGNPVRAGPRPPPGSGDALVVPGAGVVSKGLSADVAAEPISNYRNALVAYPNGEFFPSEVEGKSTLKKSTFGVAELVVFVCRRLVEVSSLVSGNRKCIVRVVRKRIWIHRSQGRLRRWKDTLLHSV